MHISQGDDTEVFDMGMTRISSKNGLPVKVNEGNGWFCGGPYNERDRRRFEALVLEDKLWVEDRARQLYGLYTISRSWTMALNECLDSDVIGVEGNMTDRGSGMRK